MTFSGRSKRMKIKYELGFQAEENGSSDIPKHRICHSAFAKLADLNKYTKEKVYTAIRNKSPDLKSAAINYHNRTKVSEKAFSQIQGNLVRNQVEINKDVLASFVVPNTEQASKLQAWMTNFFKAAGDQIGEEIHLDACPRQEIHEEFTDNMKKWFGDTSEEILGYSSFLKMWDLCFDHVKIRDNNKIGTKCHCCERLSILRRRSRDYTTRLGVSTLFSYHRHMFMCEKRAYHQRMIQAIMHPSQIVSVIGDGMDKEKTKLPRLNRVTIF